MLSWPWGIDLYLGGAPECSGNRGASNVPDMEKEKLLPEASIVTVRKGILNNVA